jgi:type IV secretory pathway VirB9-like protein
MILTGQRRYNVMLKTIIIASMLMILPSLTVAQDEAPLLQPVEEPVYLKPATPLTVDPAKLYISSKNARLDKKGEKAVQLANDWISKPVLPTVEDKDGAVVFTFGATLPVVVCRPLRVCVLQLEPGEEIIDPPRCGDTAQWEISPSKPDDRRQPHIYIKPLDSGLTTNLVVVTDRRTYVVALQSRNDKYTPMVSFRYPENEERAWQEHLAE